VTEVARGNLSARNCIVEDHLLAFAVKLDVPPYKFEWRASTPHLSTEEFENFPLQGFVPPTLYLVKALLAERCFLLNTQVIVGYVKSVRMAARKRE
jgi:hypothetical protein